jgi:V/A-type H+-transporting ATPase subunit E
MGSIPCKAGISFQEIFMEQKIAELTEKIYKEGVEKGEEQKKSIVEGAKTEASAIRADAKTEADKIIADAQAKAEEIKKNAESEMKLSSQQAISALKQRIVDTIITKAVDENVTSSLSDPKIIQELLTIIVKNWKFGDMEVPSLEILVPENSRKELETSFENSLKEILKGGVTVSFSKAIKGGFQIGPKGGTFKISLTDEDFNEFFKDYLRPKTRSFLFEE